MSFLIKSSAGSALFSDGISKVTTSVTEVTMLSITVPGGTLGIGDILAISARGSFNLQGDSNTPPTLRFNWGGTTIAAVNLGANGTPDEEILWLLDYKIAQTDDQEQEASGNIFVATSGVFNPGPFFFPKGPIQTGTLTKDQDQNIIIAFTGAAEATGNAVIIDMVTVNHYKLT